MSNTEYTFDIVAVATLHIGAPDYATARRAAEGLMEFNVRDNTVDESTADPPGLTYELTVVAPRGKASFFDADPEDESVRDEDVQTFEEPLLDVRDQLKAALDEADEALGGDSNDAEHDALYSVRETIAGLLDVTYDAPSPDYGLDDEDDAVSPPETLCGGCGRTIALNGRTGFWEDTRPVVETDTRRLCRGPVRGQLHRPHAGGETS